MTCKNEDGRTLCRRPKGIHDLLKRHGRGLPRGHRVVGPVDQDDTDRKQGVYVLAAKRPGGWLEPVKVGHVAAVRDRLLTICAERWCRNVSVTMFVLYTPGLRTHQRKKIEDAVRDDCGL